jgi:hypothetical protein
MSLCACQLFRSCPSNAGANNEIKHFGLLLFVLHDSEKFLPTKHARFNFMSSNRCRPEDMDILVNRKYRLASQALP